MRVRKKREGDGTRIPDEKEREEMAMRMQEMLRALRKRAGISQLDLARAIGVSRQTMVAYENEKCLGWKAFLALEFFFAFNSRTKDFLLKDPLLNPEKIFTEATEIYMREDG